MGRKRATATSAPRTPETAAGRRSQAPQDHRGCRHRRRHPLHHPARRPHLRRRRRERRRQLPELSDRPLAGRGRLTTDRRVAGRRARCREDGVGPQRSRRQAGRARERRHRRAARPRGTDNAVGADLAAGAGTRGARSPAARPPGSARRRLARTREPGRHVLERGRLGAGGRPPDERRALGRRPHVGERRPPGARRRLLPALALRGRPGRAPDVGPHRARRHCCLVGRAEPSARLDRHGRRHLAERAQPVAQGDGVERHAADGGRQLRRQHADGHRAAAVRGRADARRGGRPEHAAGAARRRSPARARRVRRRRRRRR